MKYTIRAFTSFPYHSVHIPIKSQVFVHCKLTYIISILQAGVIQFYLWTFLYIFLPILVPTEGPCSSLGLLLVARSFGSRNEHFTLLRDFFH